MWARDYGSLVIVPFLVFSCGKSDQENRRGRGPTEAGKGGSGAAGEAGSAAAGEGGRAGSDDGGQAGEDAGGAGGGTVCAPDNPILITSEAELAAFAAERCQVLASTLTIRSPTLTTLDALGPSSPLRIIEGDLVLDQNPMLENIEALHGLETIGGSLVVTGNYFQGLAGLHGLRTIGSSSETNTLVIAQNERLSSVSALGERLTSLRASVVVSANAVLTSLDGIDRLTVANNISITNNPVLSNFVGLSDLEEATNLTVVANAALVDLSLPSLQNGGTLMVTTNDALESVSVPALARADALTIAANPVLTTLGTLDALVEVNSLVIAGNPMLPQCFVDALDARLDACNMRCAGNDASAVCD